MVAGAPRELSSSGRGSPGWVGGTTVPSPSSPISTVVFALYVFGTKFAALEQSQTYAAGASLVLLGIVITIVLELAGIEALPFAVGCGEE